MPIEEERIPFNQSRKAKVADLAIGLIRALKLSFYNFAYCQRTIIVYQSNQIITGWIIGQIDL